MFISLLSFSIDLVCVCMNMLYKFNIVYKQKSIILFKMLYNLLCSLNNTSWDALTGKDLWNILFSKNSHNGMSCSTCSSTTLPLSHKNVQSISPSLEPAVPVSILTNAAEADTV